MTEPKRKRIVILGGGFGGIYTAKHLEKALGRSDDFEIVLVNRENYFVFQPMTLEPVMEQRARFKRAEVSEWLNSQILRLSLLRRPLDVGRGL